jgi:DNA-binding PadR family transcriptional regulator
MLQSPLTIEHALLGFLRQSPMHGYEIYQRMSDAKGLGAVWHLKQSHLYALLTRLEKEGLVRSTLEPQGVHPPRKVFHLTPSGERAFLDWVQHAVEHGRDIRLDFLVKFYFAQREGMEVTLRLIERQRLACQNWLTRQQAVADSLNDDQAYEHLVNQFRIGQIEAMLDWLDSCEQTVGVIEPAV